MQASSPPDCRGLINDFLPTKRKRKNVMQPIRPGNFKLYHNNDQNPKSFTIQISYLTSLSVDFIDIKATLYEMSKTDTSTSLSENYPQSKG